MSKITELLNKEAELNGEISHLSHKNINTPSLLGKYIKKGIQLGLTSLAIIGASNAFAAEPSTFKTYEMLKGVQTTLAANNYKTTPSIEQSKAQFETQLNNNLTTLKDKLYKNGYISIEEIKVVSGFIDGYGPKSQKILAQSSPKDNAILIGFASNYESTYLNIKHVEDPQKKFNISTENLFEFIVFHEIGHVQHNNLASFKSSQLSDQENQKLSKIFKQSSDAFFTKNIYTPMNYANLLQENYADSFAALSYLHMNKFSNQAIKDIEGVRKLREFNSSVHLESMQKNFDDKPENIIDSYSTYQSLDYILKNIDKYKNIQPQQIKETALDIASTHTFQLIFDNKNNIYANNKATQPTVSAEIDKPILDTITTIASKTVTDNISNNLTTNIKNIKLMTNDISMKQATKFKLN